VPLKDLRFKPKYQPWNEEEFWSDVYVQAMPRIAAHLYKALCNAAFFCSTRPLLPASDAELWLHAHAENIDQWLAHKSVILKRFQVVNVSGRRMLKHKRVAADWERLRTERETLSEHGKKGNEKRWGTERPPIGKQSPPNSPAIPSKRSEVSEESKQAKIEAGNQIGSEEIMAKEKALHKRLAQTWQEVKGSEGAVCPYPYFQKDAFEDLARMHSSDVIMDAFRLYAQDAPSAEREKYPIDKFMINANDYMLKARPATEPEVAPVDPALKKAQEDLILKLARESTERLEAPGKPRSEMSPEDFLSTE
jgi:hypothetical protein